MTSDAPVKSEDDLWRHRFRALAAAAFRRRRGMGLVPMDGRWLSPEEAERRARRRRRHMLLLYLEVLALLVGMALASLLLITILTLLVY